MTEIINGIVFEARTIRVKATHRSLGHDRVLFFVNGQAVSAAVYALDRAAAHFGTFEPTSGTSSPEPETPKA